MKKLIGCFFFLFLCVPVWAVENGGEQPVAYLQLGAGGLENAMAGATAGLRGSISEAFWNPAGIVGMRGTQMEYEHTVLSLNQTLEYFTVGSSFQSLYYFGLTAFDYSAGNDLQARTEPTLNPDFTFSDTELAFLLTAAFRLDPQWDLGLNIKFFAQTYGTDLPSGFGIGEDVGLQYRPSTWTTWGFVVENGFSDFIYSDQTDAVFPLILKLGVGQRFSDLPIKGDFDLEWSANLGFQPRLGMEWRPFDEVALRGGCTVELDNGSQSFTGGIGILIPSPGNLEELDYTILPDRVYSGQIIQQLSISAKFL